jgi:hypothetical protein
VVKRLMSALAALIVVGIVETLPSYAKISQAPDFIENRLAKADFVYICVATQITQTGPPALAGGKLTPLDYEATIQILQVLKGGAPTKRENVIFTGVDPMLGPPLPVNLKYVLFLNRLPDGKFQLSGEDAQSIIVLPEDISIEGGSGGLNSFEVDLADDMRKHVNDPEGVEMMNILLQFHNISSPTISELDAIGKMSPSKLSLLALEVLCRSGGHSRKYVPRLIAMLNDIGTKPPMDFTELGNLGYGLDYMIETIDNDTTVADLEGLKKLSNFKVLGLDAMAAIRRFHDPETIPFLVTKLDSDDRDIQYEAVITLAEVTGKDEGDFAPGGGPFDQNPSKYIALWKDWYQSQGKP